MSDRVIKVEVQEPKGFGPGLRRLLAAIAAIVAFASAVVGIMTYFGLNPPAPPAFDPQLFRLASIGQRIPSSALPADPDVDRMIAALGSTTEYSQQLAKTAGPGGTGEVPEIGWSRGLNVEGKAVLVAELFDPVPDISCMLSIRRGGDGQFLMLLETYQGRIVRQHQSDLVGSIQRVLVIGHREANEVVGTSTNHSGTIEFKTTTSGAMIAPIFKDLRYLLILVEFGKTIASPIFRPRDENDQALIAVAVAQMEAEVP